MKNGPMVRVTSLVVVCLVCSLRGAFCAAADARTEEDLRKLLELRVKALARPIIRESYLDVLEGEAARLVAEVDVKAIPAFEAICRNPRMSHLDRNVDLIRLAALTLAKMPNQPKAVEALERLAGEANVLAGGGTAFVGIGYLPAPLARDAAERLARRASAGYVRMACIDLLPAVGNDTTVAMLKALPKRGRGQLDQLMDSRIDRSVAMLKKILSLDDATRRPWQRQALDYWKAEQGTRRTVAGPEYMETAEHMHKIGVKFSLDFLREEIRLGSPLAMALAGQQREAALIDDLRPVAGRPWDNGPVARAALQRIGTSAALRALELSLDSDDEHLLADTLLRLQQGGDRVTLSRLRRLVADKKRSPRRRDEFCDAADKLEAHLKSTRKLP